jgi:hypothetical protein
MMLPGHSHIKRGPINPNYEEKEREKERDETLSLPSSQHQIVKWHNFSLLSLLLLLF